MRELALKLGDASGLMAFAATVRDDEMRQEIEARAVKAFWASITGAVGKPPIDGQTKRDWLDATGPSGGKTGRALASKPTGGLTGLDAKGLD